MHNKVLQFWFEEIQPSQWWKKDNAFDAQIVARFADLHAQANRCELYAWRKTAQGRLAEILILDQFSRNMFRDTPLAFASDPLALALSQQAVALNLDNQLTATERNFLYMPFMHSESSVIHEVAVTLFTKNGVEASLDFEMKHKKIIDQFDRYPHRNAILGRKSTPHEIAFLQQPDSSF